MACFNLEIKTENIDTEKIDRAQGSTQDSLLGLCSPEAQGVLRMVLPIPSQRVQARPRT